MPSFPDLAPGLWFLALAFLCGLGLRRWDELPWGVVLWCASLPAVLFAGVLFRGEILLPFDTLRGEVPFRELAPLEPHGNPIDGDLVQLIHPARVAVGEALRRGEWPLWQPRVGAGMPLLGNPQAQALQPLALAALPLPALARPALQAALTMFLALGFGFLLLRRLGAGVGPALAGATSFGMGGFVQLWLGWPLANTAVWLAASWWAFTWVEERGERRDVLRLAFALAALLLGGHPETILYGLLAVAIVAARRFALDPRGQRRAFAARCLVAGALAGLVAAPAGLTFLEILPDSLRWSRQHEAAAVNPPVASPGARAVQALAPNALGNSRFAAYWGARNTAEDAAGFPGTTALLALGLALAFLPSRGPVRHERLALAGAAVALGAISFGASGRLALFVALGAAVVTAGTLERLARWSGPRRAPWVALLVVATVLASLHLFSYDHYRHPTDPGQLDVLRWGFVLWHLRFLVLTALALAVGLGRRWPAWVCTGALAAELALAFGLGGGAYHPPAPARLAFPAPASLTYLRTAAGSGTGRVAVAGTALPPNLAALYGLSDVRIYDPMAPVPYLELLTPGIASWANEAPRLSAVDHPVYDRLAVGWWLLDPAEPCPNGTRESFADPTGRVCQRPSTPALARVASEGVTTEPSLQGDHWHLPAPPSGSLEVALYHASGWRTLHDGQPSAASGVLLQTTVPAGTARVDLLYRPTGFVVGCLLAALGAALMLATGLTPRGSGSARMRP